MLEIIEKLGFHYDYVSITYTNSVWEIVVGMNDWPNGTLLPYGSGPSFEDALIELGEIIGDVLV